MVGVPAGPRLLEQVGGAGGNPLFVIELVGLGGREKLAPMPVHALMSLPVKG